MTNPLHTHSIYDTLSNSESASILYEFQKLKESLEMQISILKSEIKDLESKIVQPIIFNMDDRIYNLKKSIS